MREPNRILTAQDLMTTSLITFRPKQTILEAISTLTKNGVSGAPVVDDEGLLVGILSERAVEERGGAQVGGELHPGDRHEPDSRISHFFPDDLGELGAHLLRHPPDTD